MSTTKNKVNMSNTIPIDKTLGYLKAESIKLVKDLTHKKIKNEK